MFWVNPFTKTISLERPRANVHVYSVPLIISTSDSQFFGGLLSLSPFSPRFLCLTPVWIMFTLSRDLLVEMIWFYWPRGTKINVPHFIVFSSPPLPMLQSWKRQQLSQLFKRKRIVFLSGDYFNFWLPCKMKLPRIDRVKLRRKVILKQLILMKLISFLRDLTKGQFHLLMS